ncbi:MAG: FG-GAP repeat protein, partial [Planctomycetia bacterium]|nr:FG-GAP repeat protein [Planctomycetia bacterium]
YAAAVGDLDGDGDRDVVLVSMFNNWDDRTNASVVWLENDGRQQFHCWQIDSQPTHRVTVAVGDLDGDGRADIVTGGLHLMGPFDRQGRLSAWYQTGRSPLP